MTGQAEAGGLSAGEMLEQLGTRFRITANFGDGPPLDLETGLLAKMTPGWSWSIVRLEGRVPPA
jgi:hypothetical protein